MAPPRLYELPHEQLVRLLRESKLEGLSFDEAWERAMRPGKRMVLANTTDAPAGCVRWPTDSSERSAWQNAIRDIRDAFRRAYQGRPMTRREEAAVKINVVLAAGDRQRADRGIGRLRVVRSAA